MTHESFKRRIASLEEARKQQDAPVQIVHINFVGADKTPIESTVARGRDFECVRLAGEGLDAFRVRADSECRATADPRLPQVLIFFGDDDDQ